MRVRPDGVELLRAARGVIDTAIVPHLANAGRDTLHVVERAIALAEDRLTQDVEASAGDLAALEAARAAMRGEVLEWLPEERRYDARLVAKAISVAALQLADAHLAERHEYEGLAALLGTPTVAQASPGEIRRRLPALNERLVARIRAGEADPGTMTYTATILFLEATVHEALSESHSTDQRPTTDSTRSGNRATASPGPAESPVDETSAARRDVPRALSQGCAVSALLAPLARIDGWLQLYRVVGEAAYVSSNVALTAQADVFGWFTQRLAANPRVPMAVVEGAHQAHDLSLALADASATLFKLALAPFRPLEARPADATRLP